MNLYKSFETNEDYERTGIWVQLASARFLVARAGGSNRAFIDRFTALQRPYRRQIEKKIPIAEDVSREIMITCMVDTIILDWENVTDRNDEPLPYSKDNCRTLLKDLPELRQILLDASMEANNFLVEEAAAVAESAGNS